MANQVKKAITLQIVYKTGVNEKGEDILKGKSYKNIHVEAEIAKVLSVAEGIASLQQYEPHTTNTILTSELVK